MGQMLGGTAKKVVSIFVEQLLFLHEMLHLGIFGFDAKIEDDRILTSR